MWDRFVLVDRGNDDIVAAQLANLFEGFFACAFADGQHCHNAADAEYDTQHGQKGPQLVK
jgi:hypothetical protein